MHIVTDTSELWKGLSDIPLALLAGIFAFSLLRRSTALHSDGTDLHSDGTAFGHCHTCLLFAGICLSSLAGIVLHCFDFTRRQLDYGWTALYLLLYFCLWLFYGEMVHVLTPGKGGAGVPSPYAAAVFFAAAYVVTVIVLYLFEGPDIFVFAAAALVMVIPLTFLAIKNRPLPEGFGLLFLFLLAAVCCQFFSEVVPFIVAGEHLFICAALCCLYRILR